MKNLKRCMISYSLLIFVLTNCQPTIKKGLDIEPVKNLILFDRDAQRLFSMKIEEVLQRSDSVPLPSLNLVGYSFAWGGEVGGPWSRVLCFYRNVPTPFQCEFFYEGEYEMSLMRGVKTPIQKGENHSLGIQLSQVAKSMGSDVYLDKEKVKNLLVFTMEKLLDCPRITKTYMDSLDMKNLPEIDREFNYQFSNKKGFIKTIQKVKNEMTINPDPNVFFFNGELINGIWKGTVRQYDHTGRFCIDLEYLNGEYAYTIWM